MDSLANTPILGERLQQGILITFSGEIAQSGDGVTSEFLHLFFSQVGYHCDWHLHVQDAYQISAPSVFVGPGFTTINWSF